MAGLPLSLPELMRLGEKIGSDVAFCLVGGHCSVKGKGERVTQNRLTARRTYVLIVPAVEVSTRWVYSAWDAEPITNDQASISSNDLEPVVIKNYPVVQKIKDKLLTLGCSVAQMSGSGPSVFGFPADEKIRAQMEKEFPRSYLAHAVEQGVELISYPRLIIFMNFNSS